MTELTAVSAPSAEESDAVSLLTVVNFLIRSRRLVLALTVAGGVMGLLSGLISPRLYMSGATFIPEGNDAPASGLALAASQFGISIPSAGSSWGPPVYVELLRSRELLAPIVFDTITVPEEGAKAMTIMQLLKVSGATPAVKTDNAVQALSSYIGAAEEKKFGGVRLSVTTPWPSVSFTLANRLVTAVNNFNLKTRKTKAASEWQFVEVQSAAAERALRDAENRLQYFLQANKVAVSPELSFERDRLQRELSLRQQLYTSWLQNREEARIRQIRDTPVLTVLESPVYPVGGESRRSLQKAVVASIGGFIIGVLLSLLHERFHGPPSDSDAEMEEFLREVKRMTPRFLRRKQA